MIEEGPTAVSVELLARLVGVPWNVVTKALLSAAMVTLDYRCTVTIWMQLPTLASRIYAVDELGIVAQGSTQYTPLMSRKSA